MIDCFIHGIKEEEEEEEFAVAVAKDKLIELLTNI